ncbi:MAG: hypothetical protein Ta2B_10910 [Termitinemataceae bacterium]|nr:MAG: hypothetical protein Ta2B_10910 [Termitinemataceae bacterium]
MKKTFNKKEVKIIKLALEAFLDTLGGENYISAAINASHGAALRCYVAELLESIYDSEGD